MYSLRTPYSKLLTKSAYKSFKSIPQPNRDYFEFSTEVDDFPSQCGMAIIHELHKAPEEEQLELIIAVLHQKPVSQIILTDTVHKTNTLWSYTKKYAEKGTKTVNPNSKNTIRHYTITRKIALKMVNDFVAKHKKK